MNVQNAAIQILQDTGRPLHAKEIAERIIEAGLWSSDGKTPEATVSARLYTDIKKHGDQSTFVKVAPQTFFLRDVQIVAVCDAKEPKLKNVNPTVNSKENQNSRHCLSFLDAAEKVLDQFGNRNSMHYRKITDKAINQGWLNTSGKTPEATMNAQLVTELKRAKASGEPGRFVRTSPGYYSLVKGMGTGLPYQISKHNREIRKKLLSQLMGLSPAQFEELVGQLLAEMGFESIEVTKYGNDGGIDVRGTMLISDVVRIKMAVQAKRWKRNIQSPTVQQVRGSLGVHEQGLIISTSDFSTGAIKEANQPDKTPVGLMNGEQLVTLLMEYNIGVRRMSHDLFELEEQPIEKGDI
ncbi:MAG: HTH domain-containing protein [Desulfobulbaceae bacterium]|nr:HTH domain-containing protein [Desulfobulbaceae bacterium]